MKILSLWTLLLVITVTASHAASVTVTGIRETTNSGAYEINGANYWWMCIEPNGSPGAAVGQSFTGNATTLVDGWYRQNTARETFFLSNPGYIATSVVKQMAVYQYVLDTYLPWNTLAGASGRFEEQILGNANPDTESDPFFDPFRTIQHFGAELYGKTIKTDFTDMTDFNANDWAAEGATLAAQTARASLWNTILSDVESKDSAAFFDTYVATHDYYLINVTEDEGTPANWQDALIIGSLSAVPEPSGALLAGVACLWGLRRRRR